MRWLWQLIDLRTRLLTARECFALPGSVSNIFTTECEFKLVAMVVVECPRRARTHTHILTIVIASLYASYGYPHIDPRNQANKLAANERTDGGRRAQAADRLRCAGRAKRIGNAVNEYESV